MDLSNRLLEITKFVPFNSIVADIGTDHGYIPIYLIINNISKKVIASDLSPGSLQKTIEYVNKFNLNDRISPRLGDGLDIIKPYEVDTVIIAGMGGLLISEILEKNKDITNTITKFILQPMVASKELRSYLLANGYMIEEESLAKEGKRFYEIIVARKGESDNQKDIYYEIGYKLIEKNHPLLGEFIEHKKKAVRDVMAKLTSEKNPNIDKRYSELSKILKAYEEVESLIEGKEYYREDE